MRNISTFPFIQNTFAKIPFFKVFHRNIDVKYMKSYQKMYENEAIGF